MKRENITKQTILVAFMPDYVDWNILHEQLWYRIPVEKALLKSMAKDSLIYFDILSECGFLGFLDVVDFF
jgi:hypothetical protein